MIAEALRRHGRIEDAEAGAAMALGDGETGDALGDEPRPKVGVVAVAGRSDGAAALHRQSIGEKASKRGLELLLFLREVEFHGSTPRRRRGRLRLAGKPQAALADDVLLDVGGAAANHEADAVHLVDLPGRGLVGLGGL